MTLQVDACQPGQDMVMAADVKPSTSNAANTLQSAIDRRPLSSKGQMVTMFRSHHANASQPYQESDRAPCTT
ncbi:unnamed protein product [Gongylonema pulchrum]|uniref:Uncharacterized protein n=1 Tax=Gongylonema pulchrum TaxID=637853 RepID=A0A183DLK3_9BILA|nr:unnamed protein product [Gongylonema pulchrum]